MTLRTDEGRGEVVYQAPFQPSVQMQRIKVADGALGVGDSRWEAEINQGF